jgi:aspartyl/glutamyl-tRNA(Asn/Gln) amidotransferase C subunit
MLTQEEVQAVAALARIELTEVETTRFQKELETLDTDSLEEVGHITGRMGEAQTDIPMPSDTKTKERIHANFPESEDGYLAVRSVF